MNQCKYRLIVRGLMGALLFISIGAIAGATQYYTVSKSGDDGSSGTLRWALTQSEQDGTDSVITFSVGSVSLTSDLPLIKAGALTLDGGGAWIDANGSANLRVRSSSVVIRNLTFDGSPYGVQIQSASGCTLSGVTVLHTSSAAAISLSSASSNRITGCTMKSNASQGLLLNDGSFANTIDGNQLDGNDSGIAVINGSNDNVFTGNRIANHPNVGISINGNSVRTIIGPGNQLTGNGNTTIYVDTAGTQITRNTLTSSGGFGIFLTANAANAVLDGNAIDTCGLAGVYATGTYAPTLSRNVIVGSQNHYGIAFDSVSGGIIGPGNQVALCTFGGIYLFNSDPCLVINNPGIVLNFGPGVGVSSTKPRSSQQEIRIEANVFGWNPIGISLSWGTGRVRARLNRVVSNTSSGIEVLGDVSASSTNLQHVLEGNYVGSNGYSGISTYFASGMVIQCNLVEDSEGPGLDLQDGGDGDLMRWNVVRQNGVGIDLVLSHDSIIENNYVQSNQSYGIHCGSESNTLRNNVVTANRLSGINCFLADGNALFVNNTIVENGVGIDASGSSWNNVCYGNDYADVVFRSGLSTSYCDIGKFLGGDPHSNGNFSGDPKFRDLAAGDLHLQESSPCKNTGSNSAPGLPPVDFDASPYTGGDPRILEGRVDVGADESGGSYVGGSPGPGAQLVDVAHQLGLSPGGLPGLDEAKNLLRKLLGQRRDGAGVGPKTYTVTNLNDSGPGSLREAIVLANVDMNASLIQFAPSLRGTIPLSTKMPTITDIFGGTDIEGTVESDGVTPKIKLASAAGIFSSAFVVASANNTIRNLEVDVSVDAIGIYGRAHDNLLENVRVRNTDNGLGIQMLGADHNVLRRCVCTNNHLPGFYVCFGADDNLIEDCVGDDQAVAPGLAIIGSTGNTVRGTSPGSSHFSRNATGIVLLAGAQDNVVGPNIAMVHNGWSQPGGGISLLGALTADNTVTGVTVDDSNDFGVQMSGFCSSNTLTASTVSNSADGTVVMDNAPGSVIDSCKLSGRSGSSRSLVSAANWSPNLAIQFNTLTASGASAGIQLQGAASSSVTGNHISGTFADYAAGVSLDNGCDGTLVRANVIGTAGGLCPGYGVQLQDAPAAVVMENVIHVGNSGGQSWQAGIRMRDEAHDCVIGPDNEIDGAIGTGSSFGICVDGSSQGPNDVKIAQNLIDGGSALSDGIRVPAVGTGLIIDSNDVSGCTASGVSLAASSSTRVVNNVIHDNQDAHGIQLPWDCSGAQPSVLFNTVVCNGTPVSGDGRFWYNIFWQNDANGGFNLSKADIHCNDVQGRASLGLSSDNSEIDPEFVNGSCGGGGNFHLQSGSPLIDLKCQAGKSPPPRPNHDVDSEPRPRGSDYDTGADEAR